MLIVILVLVLISIFSIYIYRVYIKHQNEQSESAQTALLNQISGKIDSSLLLLSENGNAIWQNPVLIPAVIVPSLSKTKQNFNATSFLAQNVTYFEYFDRLILKEQTSDIVYSSGGGVSAMDSSVEKELLNACISGENRSVLAEKPHQYDVSLVYYGSGYYMVWRFIEGRNKYLGVLIAKLNTEALFSGLAETLAESGYGLKISDSLGNTVFSAGESNASFTVNSLTSGVSGFHYSLDTPHRLLASPRTYIRLVFPFIAVVLIAGLAFSLLVAQRVYNPINQLLFSLPADAAEGYPEARSELDLLSKTMETMRSDKEAAEAFREQVRPEMEKNLLQRLLEGNLDTQESLPAQLLEIRSVLRENGKYQVLIACLPKTDGIDTVVQYMALRQLSLKIENACGDEPADIYLLHPQNNQMPLVIQFNEGLSLAKCKQIYPHLLNALRDHELVDQSVLLASGSIYQGLASVPDSYREAEQVLRKSLYYNSDETDEPSGNAAASVQDQYLDTSLIRLKELYSKREMLLFEEFLTMLLKDLQAEETDLPTYKANCLA
ncbi:MAG: hypothetical protein K6C06_10785, partial [Lachnospiraceae bacterium]|nr:hypothetical protein [Lachnospiraceae bacterium]